jgi:outer membrane usher protein
MTAAQAATLQAFDLYLEVTINRQPTHSIVSFRKRGEALAAQREDLSRLGIELARVPASSAGEWIDLGAVPGLRYRVDESHQSIDLVVEDAARTPYALGRPRPLPPMATTGTGIILNYDAYAQTAQGAGTSLSLASEQRWFGPAGVLANTGITTVDDGLERYVRESTTYQYDDPDTMTTFAAGDAVSSALAWTRPVRFGGFEWSRNFSLRPDLVTFPIPQLAGSAALPSTVDLYVNNVRQLSSEVPSGPFVINGAATITGAGIATLVVHDAMGRAVSTSLPLYVDSRLLASGLSSYSVEGGMLRYNYGLESFDYEGRPAMSGTYRLGVSDLLTVETHGEATPSLIDSGAGALLRVGEAGVLNGSLAVSSSSAPHPLIVGNEEPAVTSGPPARAAGAGEQASVGYQLILPRFSISAQSTRAFRGYADLATVGGTPAPRILDQLTASAPCGREEIVGVSLVHLDDAVTGRSQIAGAWYSARVSRIVSTFLNLSRDFDQRRSMSVSIGLSMDFGDRVSAYTSAGASGGRAASSASAGRSADYGGGWEWAAQTNRIGDTSASLARLGYLGEYGEIVAALQDASGRGAVSVEATGGVLFMDGVAEPARRIGAAFALVSTDGTPGVPVYHENRLLGDTDGGGHLLVPDLTPYGHNNLSIDPLNLPAEDKVPVDRLDVTPRGESGVLAHFPIEHYFAATVTLLDSHGRPLPVGTEIHVVESRRDFVVGYDGIAFIEGLAARNHLAVRGSDFACLAVLEFTAPPHGAGALLDLGKVTCQSREAEAL